MASNDPGRLTLPLSIFSAKPVGRPPRQASIRVASQEVEYDDPEHVDEDGDMVGASLEAEQQNAGLQASLTKNMIKKQVSLDILTPVLLTQERLLQLHKRHAFTYTRGDQLHEDDWPPRSCYE